MRVVIFSFVLLALMVGCASHKPPMPKGKWVAVNHSGYIPPNVTKYRDSVATITQDIETNTKTDKATQNPVQADKDTENGILE